MFGMKTQQGNQKVARLAIGIAGKTQAECRQKAEDALIKLSKEVGYEEANTSVVRDRLVDYVVYNTFRE